MLRLVRSRLRPPPTNKNKHLAGLLAAVATVIGDRYFTVAIEKQRCGTVISSHPDWPRKNMMLRYGLT